MTNAATKGTTWLGCILGACLLAAAASGCSGGDSSGSSGTGSSGASSTSSSSGSSGASTCDPVGSWDVQFQWSGRTPGELTVVVGADHRANVPAGPGVGATSGTTTMTGDELVWAFEDGSTFTGKTTASCTIASGAMLNTKGVKGSFTASKGGTASSSSGGEACHGCTADADCGQCERCQRTTCTCVARLSCP